MCMKGLASVWFPCQPMCVCVLQESGVECIFWREWRHCLGMGIFGVVFSHFHRHLHCVGFGEESAQEPQCLGFVHNCVSLPTVNKPHFSSPSEYRILGPSHFKSMVWHLVLFQINSPLTFSYKCSTLHLQLQRRWHNMRLLFQQCNQQHILMVDLEKYK